MEIDKNNVDAQKGVKTLPPKIEAEKERQKQELIGRRGRFPCSSACHLTPFMTLDKFKGLGNMFLGKFGLSTDNFKMQQDPATGSYSVNFVQDASGSRK